MAEVSLEEREKIALKLGITKCDHCLRLCPYCPRLLAIRPDLALLLPSHANPITEPSLFQKATNFGRAVTQHVTAGLPHADEETVALRLEICHACEHFDTAHEACRVCGCKMSIKVRWAEQQCPIRKW